jgi:hypothetical protein
VGMADVSVLKAARAATVEVREKNFMVAEA